MEDERRRVNDIKIDRILLLLEDDNIGLCGRVKDIETDVQSLQRWRSYLTGAYLVAGAIIGAWLEKK